MNKEEMIWLASLVIGKEYDSETFYNSDYLYDKSEYFDDVWEYVKECKEIGTIAFKEKYKEYRLFPI